MHMGMTAQYSLTMGAMFVFVTWRLGHRDLSRAQRCTSLTAVSAAVNVCISARARACIACRRSVLFPLKEGDNDS